MRRNYWLLLATCIVTLLLVIWYANREPSSFAKISAHYTENGNTFWLMKDEYLPIVSIRMSFTHSGYAYDQEDKQGLSYMVASLLNEGAGDLNANAFHTELETIATNMSFWVDSDMFYINITTLSQHVPRAMELLGLVLSEPLFDTTSIERVRNQILVSLAKQNERPSYLAEKALNQHIFANHPYQQAMDGTEKTLRNITQDDLRAFVRNRFTRNNVVISVVGATETNTFSALLEQQLQLLPEALSESLSALEPPTLQNFSESPIHVPINVPQTSIFFALPAPLRAADDFYATYIVNYILGGGGFESRLMQHIREEKGLVYSINSQLTGHEKAGLMLGSAATESQRSHETIEAIYEEITRLHLEGITEQELIDAKGYLVHSFPLRMTKNDYLASFLDSMQRHDLGMDFLEKRNELIQNVTLSDINQAVKKWYNPDHLVVVFAGSQGPKPQ
jgi:zinc protease